MILPIYLKNKHLFIELDGNLFLFDTGASHSFTETENISIDSKKFQLPSSLPTPMGAFDAEMISKQVGVKCVGLLGMDVLGKFDHIIDIDKNQLTISENELKYTGQEVKLSSFMGFTTINANIANKEYKMLFDTGAQISFFLDDSIVNFPFVEKFKDFNPLQGEFETDTYKVEVKLNEIVLQLICGSELPLFLSAGIQFLGASGVIGNEMLINRVVGFAPRRNVMYI
ncbi:hypothetical protein M0P98_09015 [bacterium]|nr:hypothetical protein [bacterium]